MKRKKQIYGLLMLSVVLTIIFACTPLLTRSQEQVIEDLEQAVANAKTKSDHEALAAYYEEEAKYLEKKSEEHQKLAKAYEKAIGVYPKRSYVVQHCNALAHYYKEAAESNLALAKFHHELAQGIEQKD
jgi:hypothetical protein